MTRPPENIPGKFSRLYHIDNKNVTDNKTESYKKILCGVTGVLQKNPNQGMVLLPWLALDPA